MNQIGTELVGPQLTALNPSSLLPLNLSRIGHAATVKKYLFQYKEAYSAHFAVAPTTLCFPECKTDLSKGPGTCCPY